MIRTALEFHQPATLAEASALLAEHGEDAAVLGGGTVLVPLMARGQRSHAHLVDLDALGLDGIEAGDGQVVLGARATYAQAATSTVLRERVPLLAQVATGITGGAQLRNQATFAGSACYANPASDVPAVLVALGARLSLHGPDGAREVDAAAFFRDAFAVDVRPGELLVHIAVPDAAGPHGYHKLKLCEGTWPIVTAAVTTAGDGRRSVTLGGVCATPVRVALDDGEADVDATVAAQTREPWTDELAPGDYRRAVAGPVARRALSNMSEGES